MRLIHTTTLELSTFDGDEVVPPYAILSHTWGNAEVSFQDLSAKAASELDGLEGYWKIRSCCALAAREGYHFVWIDTCCIDKTSSAELSEAINSMYRWYEDAQVCYAYLADVQIVDRTVGCLDGGQQLRESRWFTRGWTLQELLASKHLMFYGSAWQELGSKWDLKAQISFITRIWQDHLHDISGASIAQKMSWASRRKTRRVEDIAYSLMGIFDVNMPLLYGEGKKAFTRLQQEIVKISDDESIFAWTDKGFTVSGMFAQSPRAFAEFENVIRLPNYHPLYVRRDPYTVTSKGLAINSIVQKGHSVGLSTNWDLSFIPLNCGLQLGPGLLPPQQFIIYLQRSPHGDFVRRFPGQLHPSNLPANVSDERLTYIRPMYVPYLEEEHSFVICNISSKGRQLSMPETWGCRRNIHIQELLLDERQWEFTLKRGESCAAVLVECVDSLGKTRGEDFGLIFRATTSTVGLQYFIPFDKTSFQAEVLEYKYSQGFRQPQDSHLMIDLGSGSYASVVLKRDREWVDGRRRRHRIEIAMH